jgi:hypothetical protein
MPYWVDILQNEITGKLSRAWDKAGLRISTKIGNCLPASIVINGHDTAIIYL